MSQFLRPHPRTADGKITTRNTIKAQKALDNIPEGIKDVLRRSLYISITELKHDTEEDHSDLIDSFEYVQKKLG